VAVAAGSLSHALPAGALATPAGAGWAGRSVLGTPVTMHYGGRDTGSAIMARDRATGPRTAAASPRSRLRQDRSKLTENPASASLVATPSPRTAVAGGQPNTPQTPGTPFLGAQYSQSGYLPPDAMGAAGPTQFVAIVNGRIRSFNKATGVADGVIDATTDSFWNSARAGAPTSDPRVRYDRLSGRWFFTMITVPTGAPPANRLMVAFSDSSTITGGSVFTVFFWNFANPSGCVIDYDTLGIDQNALYVGGNIFCGSTVATLQPLESDGLVIGKSRLLAGTPTAVFFKLAGNGAAMNSCATPGAGDDGLYTPQGVDNPDPAATFGYFAGVSLCFFGELAFAQITNPGGSTPTAALAFMAVPATLIPAPAPAMGSTHPLDTIDDRLFNAQLRNGHLWAAHNICVDSTGIAPPPPKTPPFCPPPNRDAIRWYDVNIGGPSLNQSGTVFDSTATNPLFFYDASINASGQGHVALGFTESGAMAHAQAATVGRLATDATGTMEAINVYQASAFDYNLQTTPTQRWGDYSYTSVDPNDDQTMWTIVEYANALNSWGVEGVQLIAPPPATPSATSGTLVSGGSSQTITITGTSSSGSGFFDPGAGFPNRLTATVSGGVQVNKVTYIDPTHIALDLATQCAPPGLKNLTVTNPDGQSVTVLNFLSVTGASALPDTETASSLTQYSLSNSDGSTWVEIDPALRVACTPVADQSTLLTGNVDLFTGAAGYNQDVGIFVSDSGLPDQLLAWKESGGFAGVYSPNAAYVQWLYPMTAGHRYVFKLKWKTNKPAAGVTIYAAAGPGPYPWSNTSLVAETFANGVVPAFQSSINQYNLPNSDGITWKPLDAALDTTVAATAAGTIVLGGNVDLFTGKAGYNQDVAIFVQDNALADQLVAWKESGGFAGVFSPNAAFVKATFPAVSGHTYIFKLKWKANKNASGATIYAAAGPGPSPWSQTSLVAQFVPTSANTVFTSVSQNQYSLPNSDGTTWQEMDPLLRVTVTPGANTDSIVGANVDLFTGQAGYNQDVAIFVSDNGAPDTLLVWKESGGFAGVFSPNAAAAQAAYQMTSGHAYVFKLKWKANKNASGATIYAAAGPGPAPWSHTRLIVEETN
jgi:hypothetical protein